MKTASRILIYTIIVTIALAAGCGKAQRTAKPSVEHVGPKSSVAADLPPNNTSARDKPGEQPVPAPEPRYEPPGPTDRDRLLEGGVDPREKAEVTESAMEFAQKNVPGVKHVKVCFSKLYGGWYMLLYVQKGKKMSMEHWSWNSKEKEWEVVTKDKDLSPKQVEFELKGDVAGEKCFLLK